ncbi:hypothetical protein V474_00595 [Novosphingobium barchaimii LL02]|uniref:Uncharacterized protein n=1 Tax=Novosphingobium barchaimii LL02 TaxID=1114963 RepID=A0A0J7Y9D1_9SPHN|nr:hypothetical protein [Novosphingobium barchaimii]KMS60446.1 hypothetical protein V474_00595 [Novosphingobium barchaimii LL02]
MSQDDTIVIERLTRVETKIDFIIERDQKTAETLEDHDIRIARLESSYKILATIGAILLFIATFFQDWIKVHLLG